MNRDELLTLICQMAVDANLRWGKSTATLLSSDTFDQFPKEKQEKLKDALVRAAHFPSSPKELHEKWRLTAPKNHPENVDYDKLSSAIKIKDLIFQNHAELYNEIFTAYNEELDKDSEENVFKGSAWEKYNVKRF